MRELKMQISAEDDLDLEMALDEALRQLRTGFTSGSLLSENVSAGWWEIKTSTSENE